MRELWYQLKFIKEFLMYAKNPSAEAVERFILFTKSVRRHRPSAAVDEIVNHILSDENARTLVMQRYRENSVLKIQDLLVFPEGTLGSALGRHLVENKLDVEIYARFQVTSDIEYISFRGSQVHDIWHVVAGYGVDHFGEFAVQAMTLAQTRSPLVAIFLAGDLLYASRKGAHWSFQAMKAMVQGFSLGASCKNLYGVAWEDRLGENLKDLRREVGIPEDNRLH